LPNGPQQQPLNGPQPPQTSQPQLPNQKQAKVTGIGKPEGIDPVAVLQERENKLANRIVFRLQELSDRACAIPDDLQIKAQIELRALRLFNFQRQLRQEVSTLIIDELLLIKKFVYRLLQI
jgi:SWI/SNF-related matrix-associated actin-dependent regulator of chromatin subfamily A protein 2/4